MKKILLFRKATDSADFTSGLIMDGLLTLNIGGEGEIDWGDGSERTAYNSSDVYVTHTYTAFDGSIKFYGTLTKLKNTSASNLYHDIANLPSELTYYVNYGSNTTYGDIGNLPSGLTYYYNSGSNTTSGDIGNLPSSLTYYNNVGSNTTYGDIGNLPSGLTHYRNAASNTTSGDIANIPSSLTYYYNIGQNQVNQYTASHVFNSSINYFYNRPASGYGLTSIMVDNLLIDLDASGMSSGSISLAYNNEARTSSSDVAVASLIGKGVSVTTN